MIYQAAKFRLIFFILVFPLLLSILVAGQSDCRINLGRVLSAGGNNNPPWLSPSGEFAFGFRPLSRSSSDNNEDLFLLSIWFDKVPEQTIVWSNNDHPVEEGSRIQLTNEGEFILYNSQGHEVWKAETGSQRSTCAAMLDSGNFVLINGNSSNYMWESFNMPTDTFLPGQRLRMGGRFTSRLSETDYADGRFQLRMQRDGNLVLCTIFLPTEDVNERYWASETIRNNSDTELVFDEAGFIYLERGNENIFNVTKKYLGSRQEFYYFARIDFDGVFRHYNRPRRQYALDAGSTCGSDWRIAQTTPEDICTAVMRDIGSGACGYNSYCVNSNGRPNCLCPEGYSPVDPLALHRGCRPNFEIPSCQQNGWESNLEFVEFKELNNTDWPLTDYELQTGPGIDKERCKEFCLLDCFCAAAIYNGNSCWKKKFPLSNGRQSGDLNRIALIKVPKNNVTSNCPKAKDRSTLVLVISVFLGSSLFLNLLLLIAIAVAIFVVYQRKLMNLQSADTYGVRRYTYKELHEATDGFRQQLGRGSFGTVYKGVLTSIPKKYVAIKKLDKFEKEGEKEFTAEVSAIGRTHHKNLVTLLGYCDEGNHRLLVYEYMSNGSLSGLLFGISRPRWNQRKQIVLGIASGLTYLHEECSSHIIHCDVKPQNILLDESLTPKISDFGLAKLLLSEQSRAARTHIRGTVGYFAPEWFRKASITVKVDVYSFGVVLLETICCMSSVEFAMGDQEEALIDWVYDCYSKKKLNMLVENDEEAKNDMGSVEKLVMVAIWCIQEDPSLRPSMKRVTQMLEGVVEVSVPPRPSVFSSS
ncbi:Serine/threonine protein kinase [Handroanthus impetiginosus]|uniref:Receptor-like serine/threonine-protein kinase n=1 Tax=Handroanthus impetiginosus TaxID=429701 RepID=A0A2G9I5Y6_9LAMI|nr:Serine/threonine protein kinase [Handroanthus impetiginosus]